MGSVGLAQHAASEIGMGGDCTRSPQHHKRLRRSWPALDHWAPAPQAFAHGPASRMDAPGAPTTSLATGRTGPRTQFGAGCGGLPAVKPRYSRAVKTRLPSRHGDSIARGSWEPRSAPHHPRGYAQRRRLYLPSICVSLQGLHARSQEQHLPCLCCQLWVSVPGLK